MNWDSLQQIIRILMQLGAGWLVNQGWITADMSTTLVGALISVAGIVWWALWERTRPAAPPAPPAL
jgi:hypothetical protein